LVNVCEALGLMANAAKYMPVLTSSQVKSEKTTDVCIVHKVRLPIIYAYVLWDVRASRDWGLKVGGRPG